MATTRRTFRRNLAGALVLSAFLAASGAQAWQSLAVSDDPLLRLPGTQPGQVTLEDSSQCLNCHADYDTAAEPFAWRGSMMGQAARDPIFWAAMTVAAQDSIWAIGRPNASDLCLRCHFPQGWLEGRSDPTNASLMQGSDYDGVHCGVCHRLVDPFFESTHDGSREGSDWAGYWDETDLAEPSSADEAAATLVLDRSLSETIGLYDGLDFYDAATHQPHSADFTENASGQMFVDTAADRRGPFADANASHATIYSRYHKSRYFCSTCHDVSNPVLANLDYDGTAPGDGQTVLPSEQLSAFRYGHVERTFSEFMLSNFGVGSGAAGSGAFAPDVFVTSQPNNHIARCQDCHMADVSGRGASQSKAVLRPAESTEHPNSGVPSHDLTGGNIWVPTVLASAVPGSPNHDPENEAILGQGSAVLTLDLSQGLAPDPVGLLAAAERARINLQRAASIEDIHYEPEHSELSFHIRNHTGHKLLSGFPEGRRMWVNVKVFSEGGALLQEINPYDTAAATLKGLSFSYNDPDAELPSPQALQPHETRSDPLVYEMVPSSTLTAEEHTFHFVLADGRYKDNRIPPAGFRIDEAAERLVEPAWAGVADAGYFSAEEYAGGYDEVEIYVDAGAARLEVRLYYQTTSREYIEFLRDEINGDGATLIGPGVAGDAPYLAQTDPFFNQLRAWGDAIWQLWRHNRNIDGAAPVLMAEAALDIDIQPEPAIDLEKLTNGEDADSAPGPAILEGDPVTWTYRVTNTGNVPLSDVQVTDDQGVTVTCPSSVLAAAESMDCSGSGAANPGPYRNMGTVTAMPQSGGALVSDSDASHYTGITRPEDRIFSDGFEPPP